MKHRTFYKILFIALVIWCWTTGNVNARTTGSDIVTTAETASPDAAMQPAGAQALEDSVAISERNTTGHPKEKASPAREEIQLRSVRMATQELGLKLIGTVVADDPEDSLAVIEDRTNGKQYPRREGDRVGKALIKKILRNEVIINAGRGDKMLTMLHEQPSGGEPVPYQAAGIQHPANTAESTTRLNREDVAPYFADISQLKEQLLLHPIHQENEPAGFLVRNIKRGSILWRMGLRNRDVVKGVNGRAVTSPDEADAFFQDLKKGGVITVEVERARRAQELKIEIQ
jgi:type II secretion system protein C